MILAGLPTTRLTELCREAGKIALADDPRESLNATIEEIFSGARTKRRTPAEILLSQLSVPELSMVCIELGVNSAGLRRELLEARILAEVDPARRPADRYGAKPPPDLPVSVWLEKQRSAAHDEVTQAERARTARGDRHLRAIVWGLVFLPFGLIAYATFLEALYLAVGVMIVATSVYRRRSNRAEATLLAIGEITVRGLIFAPLFSYFIGGGIVGMMVASLCVMEILCATVMAIDAESASTANFAARVELKEILPVGSKARGPATDPAGQDSAAPAAGTEEESTAQAALDSPAETDSTGVDPFHRGG